jgi:7,8-dihydropterin-6-yl-methyl-4-(beta-D-ribofuranosyl)aminobenzene 5'-phosphate synthase
MQRVANLNVLFQRSMLMASSHEKTEARMRCTVLVENTALKAQMRSEHGLSLLLETSQERWLFDLGASGAFLRNAHTLGCSLRALTGVVLSHAHRDHGGGLESWFAYDDVTPLYASTYLFDCTANARGVPLALDERLQGASALRRCATTTPLSSEATLVVLTPMQRREPIETYGLVRREGQQWQLDDFRHEVALLLETQGRRVLVSGCSHQGALNWIEATHPDVFIGGLHLAKRDPQMSEDRAYLEAFARYLLASNITLFTGHCTGAAAFAFLKERLGHRLHALSTGLTFNPFS